MIAFVEAPAGYGALISKQPEATSLIDVGPDAFGRPAKLEPVAAQGWLRMRKAAEREGYRLLLVSGFRSIQRQREILDKKLRAGILLTDALRELAFPGHSEHHTGRAIDLGSPDCEHLTEKFETTREFAWMMSFASRFGFWLSYPRGNAAGIAYEPWHWFMSKRKSDHPPQTNAGSRPASDASPAFDLRPGPPRAADLQRFGKA